MLEMTFGQLLLLFGIPSAATSFGVTMLVRQMTKKEKQREAELKVNQEHMLLIVDCVGASFALGEATAKAVRDQKCNGDMESALEHAKKIKHKHKDFLYRQAVDHLH